MAEQFSIREYRDSDKEEVISILEQNVPDYFAEDEINDFRSYIADEIEDYYVAKLDDRIVGAGGINYEKDLGIAKISWDFIHPEFHGKGIGRALLNYRLQRVRHQNATTIIVRTSQLAYRFYERHGFELSEIKKDYWAKGFDMYHMVYKNNQPY
jgi:[ribosomal protein S18]-alanine N-acetyltransferase